MAELHPSHRIVRGQSLNGTLQSGTADGIGGPVRAIMVGMAFTIVFAFTMLAGSVSATETAPHIVAVAVARAQILSGVRVGQTAPTDDGRPVPRDAVLPKPRERRCPEREAAPCRLIVVDMP